MSSEEPTTVPVPSWTKSHLGIWLGFLCLYGAFDIGRQPEPEPLELMVRAMVWAALGALLTTPWRWWLSRRGPESSRSKGRFRQAVVAVCGALAGGLLWFSLFHGVDGALGLEGGWEPLWSFSREQLFGEWGDCTLVLLVWYGATFALLESERAGELREQGLRLRAAALEQQLHSLQAQLRPHFLFNAINAAMALIHEEPDRADLVLEQLSELLRGSLQNDEAVVSLGEQLRIVELYLEIEAVRYEERLHFAFSVPEALRAVMLPRGVVLPLVDNAVKHGMEQAVDGPLRICIEGSVMGGTASLEVRNTGALSEDVHPRSLGVGLRTVRELLALRFGAAAGVELSEQASVVVARLWFPVGCS